MYRLLVVVLMATVLAGCGGGRVVALSTGYHVPGDMFGVRQFQGLAPNTTDRYVVWAKDASVVGHLSGWLVGIGYTVVERARLQQIFDEQRITLMYTPDDIQNILRVGRLVGATHVIFAETTISRGPYYWLDAKYASAAVRSVVIETGEVRWSGTAQYGKPVLNADQSLLYLAHVAMLRAICPTERGFEWKESEMASNRSPCVKAGS